MVPLVAFSRLFYKSRKKKENTRLQRYSAWKNLFRFNNKVFLNLKDIRLSDGNPVIQLALLGKVLDVPTSPLGECLDCVWSLRGPTVGELRVEFFWISWFSSWVNVDVCSFRGSKFGLIFFIDQIRRGCGSIGSVFGIHRHFLDVISDRFYKFYGQGKSSYNRWEDWI